MRGLKPLQNLNDLSRGIYKHWVWGTEEKYRFTCNCLQKISYSIQDLNMEIETLEYPSMKLTMKELIFIIALVDWIKEAVDSLFANLRTEVIKFLNLKSDSEYEKANKYFKAIRSFVLAHPLNTNRHKDIGLDGDLICVDIRREPSIHTMFYQNSLDWFILDMNGLRSTTVGEPFDCILCVYSNRLDGGRFFKYVKVNFADIYNVAKLNIEQLYLIDSKLKYLTKKKVGIKS